MEKVILVLRGGDVDDRGSDRLIGVIADDIADLGFAGLAINVRDRAVRESMMTLTTLDPPVQALVSLWTQQCYGEAVHAAVALLEKEWDHVCGYLVSESVPLAPPDVERGERTPGFANVALLRRPQNLDEATWLRRWQVDHTPGRSPPRRRSDTPRTLWSER